MSFPIRTASPQDTDDLRALFIDTAMFAAEEVAFLTEMFAEDVKNTQGERRWRVAQEASRVIAATGLMAEPMQEDVFNLFFLGVYGSARGRGVAKALVGDAETHARANGGRVMLIETASTPAFETARGLYDNLGYTVDGTIRDYYADGVDKVVFRKRL